MIAPTTVLMAIPSVYQTRTKPAPFSLQAMAYMVAAMPPDTRPARAPVARRRKGRPPEPLADRHSFRSGNLDWPARRTGGSSWGNSARNAGILTHVFGRSTREAIAARDSRRAPTRRPARRPMPCCAGPAMASLPNVQRRRQSSSTRLPYLIVNLVNRPPLVAWVNTLRAF